MDALADLAVEMDHVLAHAGGALISQIVPGTASHLLLQPAVAAPPDPQPAESAKA